MKGWKYSALVSRNLSIIKMLFKVPEKDDNALAVLNLGFWAFVPAFRPLSDSMSQCN